MNKIDYAHLRNKLPEMPGIQGRDNLFNSVVLIPFIFINGEYHILFEKRAEKIRQGGEICFPGGGVDEDMDKNSMATVLRETTEEIGIPSDQIEIDGRIDTVINSMGMIIKVFVGRLNISSIKKLKLNKEEVAKVFTVPVSFFKNNRPEEYQAIVEVKPSYIDPESGKEVILFPAKELGVPEKYAKPWGGNKHTIFVYRYDGEIIWGITARIMDEISKYFRK